jgi:drug/metabolite transporter (DMT)-like permease
VITLLVFSGVSVFCLGESLTWNHAIGFALIAAGASFIFAARWPSPGCCGCLGRHNSGAGIC